MTLRNTTSAYGKLTIILHWVMALLIIGLLLLGFFLDDFDKESKLQFVNLHKATGFTVLILVLFRWFWTLTSPKVQPLPNWSKKDIGISHAVKWSLMLLMLIMPLSGWFMSMYAGYGIDFFGLFDIATFVEKNKETKHFYHEVHEIGGIVIAVAISLHLLAALKHHFIVKDDTLNRMLGRKVNKH
jgi:cytochrome b561